MAERQQLLDEIMKQLDLVASIPPREWKRYKKEFWNLKMMQWKYVEMGGAINVWLRR